MGLQTSPPRSTLSSRCSDTSSRSIAVSKERARALLGKQESIGKLGKRIQLLLKKSPDVSLTMAKEIYKEFKTHEIDAESIISAVKRIEASMGPIVPKLKMRHDQRKAQGRGSVWTTEGGTLIQEHASNRNNDNASRHEAMRTRRRARQSARQMREQSRRANARQKQRQFSKLPIFEEEEGSNVQSGDGKYRRLKNLQVKKQDIWYRKAEMEAEVEKKSQRDQMVRGKEEQRKTKEILEAQMKQKQDLHKKKRQEREAYEANVLADVENHKLEQQRRFEDEAKKARRQADAQLAQRLERRRVREDAKKSKQREDAALLRNIEIQQEKDKLKNAEEQQREREVMKKVKQENIRQMERVREQGAQQRRQDIELANQYGEMERRRDEKRQAHIKKMQNDVKAKMARFDHLKQESDKLAERNEQKAAKEERQMQKRQQIEERKRAMKREQRIQEQQEILSAQMQEKRVRQAREKAEDKHYANEWKKEGDAMDKKEHVMQRNKITQAKKQQHWLKQQIDMRQQLQDQTNFMGMTPRERAINQQLLVKLGCSEIANKTRNRAAQLELEQKTREKMMMDRPAGLPSHRARK